MSRQLNTKQIEQFRRDGILIIPDFYQEKDILPIKRGIYDIIGQVLFENDIPDRRRAFTSENFDEGYLELIQQDRRWGGLIYDAIKQIPAFVRLVANPKHDELMKQLRKNSIPGVAAGGFGIRIDNPFEDKYRALWHQEYPAQLRSIDGLVFWSPLVPVTQEMGPVMFCLGSHTEGPLPVTETDPMSDGRSGAYALKIYNEQKYVSKYKKVAPLTNPRDLVIIDFLVLHASGLNRSSRARWSMQFRYFNFNESNGREHGWRGSYAAGVDFREIHPELFIK